MHQTPPGGVRREPIGANATDRRLQIAGAIGLFRRL
jgi:hypothetical protein